MYSKVLKHTLFKSKIFVYCMIHAYEEEVQEAGVIFLNPASVSNI